MIDSTDLKYFKLVVGKLAKESKDDCAVNCIECGDKKQRLHLYQNDGMEIALVHCYNAGCTFDDKQMGMVKFLKEVRPELVPNYKTERFKQNISHLKDANDGLSLDEILANAQAKKDGVEVKPKVEVDKDTEGISTGLFSGNSKIVPMETEEPIEEPIKTSKFSFNFSDDDFGETSAKTSVKNSDSIPANDAHTANKEPKTSAKTSAKIEVVCEDDDLLAELSDIKPVPKVSHELPEGSTALRVPELFTKQLLPCRAVPEAVAYIENRGLTVGDNWLFSKEKFIKIFDKPYYVLNFIFIPLFQNGKLRGFYTRSIEEKRFSTIVFPKGEKYWASETIDETKPCYIFEGIFDAMSSGLDNVCAMLSADLPEEFLDDLVDPIFCFDNDATGIKKALKYNKLGYKTFIWGNIKEKDMNERLQSTSIEANRHMIENNIFKGMGALMKLKMFRGQNLGSISGVKNQW